MKHYYQTIKGWFNWPELYERAVRMAPNKANFVEIGCHLGRSTSCLGVEIVNSKKDITLYAVDIWEGPTGRFKVSKEQFLETIQPIRKVVKPLHMTSVEAAKQFKDGSVDFVWVDGNHAYPHAIEDIRTWWPKLKDGGWMGGDDLIMPGVRKAVEEFFGPECASDKDPRGAWIRFQSATCHHGKVVKDLTPASGGWVWWARSKGPGWVPEGLK